MNRRIDFAFAQMDELNIPQTLEADSYIRIAQAGFDKRTLFASFVLAQILAAEQPINVRGAFYRGVSSGIYPNTDDRHYRQAEGIILKLRRAGCLPYSWVVDSLRTRTKPSSWAGLDDFAETVRRAYRKDFWSGQETYVEVVSEKDAMAGVVQPVTREYDLHLNVIRGNCSESHIWNWAESLREIQKPIKVFYLGDHDPNGLDIERDIRKRLDGFLNGREIAWERIAVTAEDFQREDLLGFPVKRSNSKAWKARCEKYIAEHGDRCVEVDAIPSPEIRERLRVAIEKHIDLDAWQRLKAIEEIERESIARIFDGGNLT